MDVSFHNVETIKMNTVKAPGSKEMVWLQITVRDKDGEHDINCFPKHDQESPNILDIPISMHLEGKDNHD